MSGLNLFVTPTEEIADLEKKFAYVPRSEFNRALDQEKNKLYGGIILGGVVGIGVVYGGCVLIKKMLNA
jgi:hypothetical protein